MKAVAKYPGSKWSLAGWIIGHFPEHHSYLEPFFGSGAVLFNKARSRIETVNDMDGNVVNLFEWIRKDPVRLAHEIYYTPYARQVYEDAFAALPEDSLGRAVNFYIRLNMGHGFRTNGEKVGWKNDVQIECRPALEVVRRFNYKNVLIYCDPPYMLETRHGKQYRHEMDDKDHEALLDALLRHSGYVAVSGYETGLYNSMLAGWNKYRATSYS